MERSPLRVSLRAEELPDALVLGPSAELTGARPQKSERHHDFSRLHTTVTVSTKGLAAGEAFSKYYNSSGDEATLQASNRSDRLSDIPIGNFSDWEVGEAVDLLRSAAVAGMLALVSEARVSGQVLDATETEVQKRLNASLELALTAPNATQDRADIVAIRIKQAAVAYKASEGRDAVYAAVEHAVEAVKASVAPMVKRIWSEALYHGLTNMTRPPVLQMWDGEQESSASRVLASAGGSR